MYGTKVRAVVGVVLAVLVTCGVVMISLAPSWGHDDKLTKSRSEVSPASDRASAKKKEAARAKKDKAAPTVIVGSETAPEPTAIIAPPEKTAATAKIETNPVPMLVAIDPPVSTASKEPLPKAGDIIPSPLGPPSEKKDAAADVKKEVEASSTVLPPPVEKTQPAKDDKNIKLVSGTEPAAPAVISSPVISGPIAKPEPAPLKADAIPKTEPKEKAATTDLGKPVANPDPVKTITPISSTGAAVDPLVTGDTKPPQPAKPATPDEELEKARTEEKQLAGELENKQSQMKELAAKHQEARARLIKALATKVDAVTKEMEKLQKELKDRQKIEDKNTATPIPEEKLEDRIKAAPIAEKKTEERLTPLPASGNGAAKEPPPAVEPAQEKTGPATEAASGKAKSKPKKEEPKEEPIDPTKPPVY